MAISSNYTPSSSINQYEYAEAITANTAFTGVCRAIYIGAAGNATITMVNGDVIAFNGLLAGTILPVRATKVPTQSTTMNMVALY